MNSSSLKQTLHLAAIIMMAFTSASIAAEKLSPEAHEFIEKNAVSLDTVRNQNWEELSGDFDNNGNPLSLERLDQLHEEHGKGINPDTIWGSVMARYNNFSINCMKVISDAKMCRCIVENTPVFTGFGQYISIILYGYNLPMKNVSSSEKKKLVEQVYKAREECLVE
jgi:hypothetical protein